jgi:hypothetical protein
MLVEMEEEKLDTLTDISLFLQSKGSLPMRFQGSKNDIYKWIETILIRFRYIRLKKRAEKGLILRYIEHITGYSRQHLTKLVSAYIKTGRIRHQSRRSKQGFQSKYTRDDIAILAEVDKAVDGASGTTVKALCQREFSVYENKRFERISQVSVSHLYNLRKSTVYQRCRRVFTKTQSTPVNIGERCKPRPNDKPGYLRVDSVHQGDLDGKKGVYHINAVDEVTQWEVVVTVPRITEQFMIPALASILHQCPFITLAFHSDNGSEYINRRVAELLNDSLVKMTKSRPRRSNECVACPWYNALAESKNNSVVRKTFGYIHIPQKHAETMEKFNQEYLNPCLNFHRPCHFPNIEINDKGKQTKRYRQSDMKTPYEKLKSIPNAEQYLKPETSFLAMSNIAMKQSDLDAWKLLQKARISLFNNIFGQNQYAA